MNDPWLHKPNNMFVVEVREEKKNNTKNVNLVKRIIAFHSIKRFENIFFLFLVRSHQRI